MTNSITTSSQNQNARDIIASFSTSASSQEEILETLARFGIDWYVTEEGDLMIRYWQIAAEGFLSPERAAVVRTTNPSVRENDELEWLSRNLQDIRQHYAGKWIAIFNNSVVGSADNLPALMNLIINFDRPFITFISPEPVVWTFTYAS